MAATQKLLMTPLTTYEPIRWKGQEVYQYYPRLRSFLTNKLGPQYANYFARPQVRRGAKGKPEIIWLSDDLDASYFEGPSALGEQSSEAIETFFRQQIIEWRSGSAEDADWATLLELCLDNATGGKVFSDGKTDVLAGWALLPPRTATGGPLNRNRPATATVVPTEISSTANPTPPAPADAPELPQEAVKPIEPTLAQPTEAPAAEVPSANEEPREESVPQLLESGSKQGVIQRFWWLLPVLLLLGALIWWVSTQETTPLLPEQPNVLVPIDSVDVDLNQDSTSIIVTNRINVMLKPPNRDMEAFAKAFKAVYPGAGYQVIYYDTMMARLQLVVPNNEREQIMEALSAQLPDFDLLVFPEALYENQATPSDPGFSNQRASWYFDVIKVPPAWDISYGSDRVIVGVVDDGFDLNHPEFSNRIVRPYNALSRNAGVYSGPNHQHGTHVAGTAIAARNNREGVAGIAPDCLLLPIQVADRSAQLPSTAIVDGVLYAINNGAKVINLSLGRRFGPFLKLRPRTYQERMIREAFTAEASFWQEIMNFAEESGVSVVFAAGNESVMAGIDPMQRNDLSIKVSAIDPNGRRASFSNYGAYTTISAPGVQIFSSVPGSSYRAMDGTSMAAPMVSGAVALAKSVNPDLTPADIRELLVKTALPRDPNIGPILQVGPFVRAANAAGGNTNPGLNEPDECADINRQIEALERQIEALKQGCETYSQEPDTMKMTPKPDDLDFTIGRWKSTTPLTNAQTKEQLTFFFRFLADGTGELTMLEASGIQCNSNLRLQRSQKELRIRQQAGAQCRGVNRSYSPYRFTCAPDATGTVVCQGVNQNNANNRFDFKLVRVN